MVLTILILLLLRTIIVSASLVFSFHFRLRASKTHMDCTESKQHTLTSIQWAVRLSCLKTNYLRPLLTFDLNPKAGRITLA